MKRLLIAIFILLALTSFGYADQTCYVSKECEFTTTVHNTSRAYYEGDNVTNSLRFSEGTYIFENETMINLGDGNYVYNHTFNNSGSYIRKSNAVGVLEDETIIVEDYSSESVTGLVMSNWIWLIVIFLIIIIKAIADLINHVKN